MKALIAPFARRDSRQRSRTDLHRAAFAVAHRGGQGAQALARRSSRAPVVRREHRGGDEVLGQRERHHGSGDPRQHGEGGDDVAEILGRNRQSERRRGRGT